MKMRAVSIIVSIAIVCLSHSGCAGGDQVDAIVQSSDSGTIWVSLQFNVPRAEGLKTFFYSGRMSEKLYHQIIDGKVSSGMLVLRDVRYWNDNDQVVKYEDEADVGTLSFRIQDLVKVSLLKGDPILLEKKSIQAEPTQ